MVDQIVFSQPHAIEILVVEPVDIGVGIYRVPTTAVDFASIHGPHVRHYINVVFRNVSGDGVDHAAINGREHC